MRVTNTFTPPLADAADATLALGAPAIPRDQVRAGDLIRFEPVGRRRQAEVTVRVTDLVGYKAVHGYRARIKPSGGTRLPTRTYELPATVQLIEPHGGNPT